jgi:hypothetical protein
MAAVVEQTQIRPSGARPVRYRIVCFYFLSNVYLLAFRGFSFGCSVLSPSNASDSSFIHVVLLF